MRIVGSKNLISAFVVENKFQVKIGFK